METCIDRDEIEQAILKRCERRDARVVAVLAGVRDRDDERTALNDLAVDVDLVLGRLVLRKCSQTLLHVRSHAALRALRESMRDQRVETGAHDAEEWRSDAADRTARSRRTCTS
jgi:hypothetical protein